MGGGPRERAPGYNPRPDPSSYLSSSTLVPLLDPSSLSSPTLAGVRAPPHPGELLGLRLRPPPRPSSSPSSTTRNPGWYDPIHLPSRSMLRSPHMTQPPALAPRLGLRRHGSGFQCVGCSNIWPYLDRSIHHLFTV